MQIVIDIPDEAYNMLLSEQKLPHDLDLEYLIMHSTPLPKGHRGIVDLKNVQWAFDDAILENAQRTGHVRATYDEIANILKTVPIIIADTESEE